MTSPLMGIGELAQRLGVIAQRASTVSRCKNFPEPERLNMGRVWDAEEVEAWIREHWVTEPR